MPRRVTTEPLTDKQVKALNTQLERIDVPDSAVPGGGIRVFASGRKVWYLIYWTPKKETHQDGSDARTTAAIP